MKKAQVIFYSVIGVMTLALVTPLAIWSTVESSNDLTEKIATLKVDSAARKEYLVGEKFNPNGLQLFIEDGKEIEIEESMIKYDFSTAGKKAVEFTYSSGSTTYSVKHYVEVFSVNNLDVSGYNNMYIDSDGICVAPGISVIANLSGPANEFKKDPRYPDYDKSCFILNPENYVITATKSSKFESYYNVVLTAGGTTYGWVYSQTEQHPDVSSTDRMIEFESDGQYNKTLMLFVQYNSNAFTGLGVGKNSDVTGTYVLKNHADNTSKEYHFKYRIETWSSYWLSENEYHEGLTDSIGFGTDGAAMKVQIGSETYYAPGTSWHKAVLGD